MFTDMQAQFFTCISTYFMATVAHCRSFLLWLSLPPPNLLNVSSLAPSAKAVSSSNDQLAFLFAFKPSILADDPTRGIPSKNVASLSKWENPQVFP